MEHTDKTDIKNSINKENRKHPKKWLVLLWSILNPALGFLYIGKGKWAIFYFLLVIGCFALELILSFKYLYFIGIAVYLYGIFHCWEASKINDSIDWKKLHIWLKGSVISIVILWVFQVFFFGFFTLPSTAMFPSFPVNSLILVKKLGTGSLNSVFGTKSDAKNLKYGEVIIFQYPTDPSISYMMRVVALPGDSIAFDKGNIILNGKTLKNDHAGKVLDSFGLGYEKFIEHHLKSNYSIARLFEHTKESYPFIEHCIANNVNNQCIVPENTVFVLGDNREQSLDSRYWGFVPSDNIKGKVITFFNPKVE